MAATRTPSSRVSAFSFLLRLILAGGVGLVLFLVANSPDQDRRLRMVCAVGACVSVFIFSHAMSGPRRQWVRGMVGRRFPHPSPALNRAGIRYLRAWDQWIRATCGIGTGAVMAVILRTSTEGPNPWFPALLPFAENLRWLALLGGLALLLSPVLTANLLSELKLRRREWKHQLKMNSPPPPASHVASPQVESTDEPPTRRQTSRDTENPTLEWNWQRFSGNIVVFGQAGSGKTHGVLRSLLDEFVKESDRSNEPAGVLILDSKGDLSACLPRWVSKRRPSLGYRLIHPDDRTQAQRWNPLDSKEGEETLSDRFVAALELALGGTGAAVGFPFESVRHFVRHALLLIRLSNPPGVPPNFADIASLLTSNRAIAERSDRLEILDHRCEDCLRFFARRWPKETSEIRLAITSRLAELFQAFSSPEFATLFTGSSTMRMNDVVCEGRLLGIHAPRGEPPGLGRFLLGWAKLEYYQGVLASHPGRRRSLLVCDDFAFCSSLSSTAVDAEFLRTSKSRSHGSIFALRSLPSLMRADDPSLDSVMPLFQECETKVFLRNMDEPTNRWACQQANADRTLNLPAASSDPAIPMRSESQPAPHEDPRARRVECQPEQFQRLSIPGSDSKGGLAESIICVATPRTPASIVRSHMWKVPPI